MKRIFTIFMILFLVFTSLCFARGNREIGQNDAKTLTDNMIKWKDADISAYTMKVAYTNGNRPESVLTLKVRDKVVVECIENDVFPGNIKNGEVFEISNMFDAAKEYVKNNKKESPMLYILKYDKKYGYINYLTRIYNPNVKTGAVPSNYNFKIKVIDFFPES